MKLAFSGLFLMLGLMGIYLFRATGDQYAAFGADGFLIASIINTTSVLKEYKGAKRQ